MMPMKKTIKGMWINSSDLYDFLYTLCNDAKARRDKINIVNHPDRAQLNGVLFTLAGIIEFVQQRTLRGNLRLR